MKTPLVTTPSRFRGNARGFSLITTISIMVLLALIAIGLLSLSAVTVRSSTAELAQLEAKANARLALMLAIGELQRELGPDQAVSAPAGVLDETPDSLDISGVEHPHWTVVWHTKWSDQQRTPWARNDQQGGLRDLRFQDGWDREDEVSTYLVSGNEGGREAAQSQFTDARNGNLNENERVRIVAEGTLGQAAGGVDNLEVYARRVPRMKNNRETGAMAWWVSDDGVKANVQVVDPYREVAVRPGFDSAGMERMLHAQDAGDEFVGGLTSNDEGLRDEDAMKSISDKTLEAAQNVDKERLQALYHDLTTGTRSVLVNVRNGGLQRDLTAYIYSSGLIPDLRDGGSITSPGLKDLDNMVGPANSQVAAEQGVRWVQTYYKEISPKFSLIRKWANGIWQRGTPNELLPFSARQAAAKLPEALPTSHPVVRGMQDNVNVYDYANLSPVSFLPFETPSFDPIMVEGAMYYNIAAFPQTAGSPTSNYVVRVCMYPRVQLWNPYNVDMELDALAVQFFVNGNKRIRLRGNAATNIRELDIPIGRGSPNNNLATGSRHPAHYRGTLLFTIPPVTLAPGQTLVFTPDRADSYQHENIFRNTLTPGQPASPDLYYWDDMDAAGGVLNFAPRFFMEFPGTGRGGRENGADNYLMALKDAGRRSPARGRPQDSTFNSLPLICYINPSLQAGGSDELPVTWDNRRETGVHILESSRAILSGLGAIPDTRTRDGFRLRWWQEHNSNIRGSGALAGHPRHLQSAAIANWNLRAAYFCRTPFDNVTNMPPYFFGVYTRDLFDPEVAFESMQPRADNGGFPFGPPVEGPESIVLFEVPREETGITSLGYLRHLQLSEFGWHNNYAIGNSLVDPRVGRTTSNPHLQNSREQSNFGWNQDLYGWDDGASTYWAQLHREILFDYPQTEIVVYDMSFEANYNLWDDYFLSTGTPDDKRAFLADPERDPLPNGRMGLYRTTADSIDEDLEDFHRAALQLALEGGFNVHSISKEAWKAILSSTADTGYASTEKGVPFPRVLSPVAGEWMNDQATSDDAMAGFRTLSEGELDRLAEEMVREVKERAPFFGMADFVNRRLFDDETGLKGPVQAAIDAAGVNSEFESSLELDNTRELPRVTFFNMSNTTRLAQTEKPRSVAWGVPGFLTQGDVLQVVGSTLRARSDTFTIRAYGESVDGNGNVQARAWCEAVVQRTPEPLDPDGTGLNPIVRNESDEIVDFGRRFRVVSFRWMAPEEV